MTINDNITKKFLKILFLYVNIVNFKEILLAFLILHFRGINELDLRIYSKHFAYRAMMNINKVNNTSPYLLSSFHLFAENVTRKSLNIS